MIKGSLDSPPIVVTSARWKLVLLILGCLVFVLTGLFMTTDIQTLEAQFWGPVNIVMFGAGGIGLVIGLFRPSVGIIE